MKITIETEEKEEVLRIMKSSEAFSALHEIAWGRIRDWGKHGHEFKTADEAVEACREEIFRVLEDYGIDLDMY